MCRAREHRLSEPCIEPNVPHIDTVGIHRIRIHAMYDDICTAEWSVRFAVQRDEA